MASLDGFKSFNFNEGFPYVSVTKNGVTFNKGVVMKMGFPRYVRFLINHDTRQVALQECDENAENAVQFCSKDKRNSKVLSIRWNGRDLLNTLSALMDWDLSKASYRAAGTLLIEDKAMLFDLEKAEELN